MGNNEKNVCRLSIYKDSPLIVYLSDENGNPIIEDKNVLLAEISEKNESRTVRLCLSGDAYHFLRYDLLTSTLATKPYDSKKIHLSQDDASKLKKIVDARRVRCFSNGLEGGLQ